MAQGFPSMTALLGLLAVAGYQNRDKIAEMLRGQGAAPAGPGSPHVGESTPGGLLGGLGGLLGGSSGATSGGLLGSGLSELLERFRQNGAGDKAQSWVASGPNEPVAPHELEKAIGPDVLDELTRRTGLTRADLLSRLSRDLPEAVDRYTPDGRLPG